MTRELIGHYVFRFVFVALIFASLLYGIKYDMFSEQYVHNFIEKNGVWALVVNIVIAGAGVPAIYMSQSLHFNTRRWASVLGLGAQPFWFMMAIHNEAWGVFLMCFFYTHAWWTGFVKHWLQPQPILEV